MVVDRPPTFDLFPTHVGMNRNPPAIDIMIIPVPHARGDEARQVETIKNIAICSPRTWG